MVKVLQPIIAVAILATAASALAEDDDWWQGGHFYQIYPRSYQGLIIDKIHFLIIWNNRIHSILK